MMRQTVGACVELRGAQLRAIEDDRDGVRSRARLLGKQLVHALVERVAAARLVPFDQDLATLGCRKQRQLGEPLPGCADDAGQQQLEVLGQCADCGALEQIGAVLDFRRQRSLGLRHGEPHVALGDSGVQRHLLQRRSLQLQPGIGEGLQREGDRVEGIAPHVRRQPQLRHQTVGGDFLVLVRLQHRAACAGEQLGERRIAAQIGPHDQRVGEETDRAVESRAQPSRDG